MCVKESGCSTAIRAHARVTAACPVLGPGCDEDGRAPPGGRMAVHEGTSRHFVDTCCAAGLIRSKPKAVESDTKSREGDGKRSERNHHLCREGRRRRPGGPPPPLTSKG